MGLVIDLDTCVGCHACVVNCKEWNTGGYPAPLSDLNAYGANPVGAWLNRVHGFEAGDGENEKAGPKVQQKPAKIVAFNPAFSDSDIDGDFVHDVDEGEGDGVWDSAINPDTGEPFEETTDAFGAIGARVFFEDSEWLAS